MTLRSMTRERRYLSGVRICAWCLGRQYSSLPDYVEETGKSMAKKRGVELSKNCELCGGAFADRKRVIKNLVKTLQEYEFETFQVGVTLPSELVEREDEMRSKLKISTGVSLKKGLVSLYRKELARVLRKRPALKNPDVTIKLKLPMGDFEIECRPVTVYATYLKLESGIAVRASFCPECGGEGCTACEWHGVQKSDGSVEGLLLRYFIDGFGAKKAKISWSGFDDDKSRVLGRGRPILVELVAPSKRETGLFALKMKLSNEVQLIEAEMIQPARELIENLKKEVLLKAKFERDLSPDEIRVLEKAYRDREVIMHNAIDGRTRKKRVYFLQISPTHDGFGVHLFLDNAVGIRQLVRVKSDNRFSEDGLEPSFADVLPQNRVTSFEYDILGFERLVAEEKH